MQGDGGPITVPPEVTVAIGGDGTISTIASTTKPGSPTVLGRLKLVNPPEADLVRGDDGLFRLKNGTAAPESIRWCGGRWRAGRQQCQSPVDAMVNMIALRVQFEMQMSLLKNAENNAAKADQILAWSNKGGLPHNCFIDRCVAHSPAKKLEKMMIRSLLDRQDRPGSAADQPRHDNQQPGQRQHQRL